jgi:TatD DNase family protein
MIDSHCHLTGKEYRGKINQVIAEARAAGVHTLINNAGGLESSKDAVALAYKFESVYATVGVHPHDASNYDRETEINLPPLINEPKVVAVGEIGLDYYRDLSPRPIQRDIFRLQLELAIEHKKPIVIHTREAFEDTIKIIREYSPRLYGGVFHCFPGTASEALEVINLGFHISVGGVITYPGSKMAEMAASIPLQYILLETDCPYLTPVPFRGKINQPAYIKIICEKLAALRGISCKEVEEVTDRNCQKLFRLVETFGG